MSTKVDDLPNPFRVLVTGFGPFGQYQENPAWLAVKGLQNEILYTDVSAERPARPDPPKAPPPPGPSSSSSKRPQPPTTDPSASSTSTSSSTTSTSTTSASTSTSTSTPIPSSVPIPLTPRPIHISTLQIPMLYESVLNIIPGLHARPPILPPNAPVSTLPPPTTAFDFILHIGVAGRGPLRMERVGHKLGYHMKDASGKYACMVRKESKEQNDQHRGDLAPGVVVGGGSSGGSGGGGGGHGSHGVGGTGERGSGGGFSSHDSTGLGGSSGYSGTGTHAGSNAGFSGGASSSSFNTSGPSPSTSNIDGKDRSSSGFSSHNTSTSNSGFGGAGTIELVSPAVAGEQGQETAARPTRGFAGPAYDTLPDEATTDIDCTKLVQDLKQSGIDQIYTSMDAGHYLCDFIYYCSLVEAKRSSKPYEKRRLTQVLCMHCCPVNLPLSTEEVADAIRRIVIWVCNQQQVQDDGSDAGAVGS